MTKRLSRLNSLLKKVISRIIQQEVRNPRVAPFTTVTAVSLSRDFSLATVYISVIGTEEQKKETIGALNSAAGFIGCHASQLVVIHHFPSLTFTIDTSVDKQMKLEALFHQIHAERESRSPPS